MNVAVLAAAAAGAPGQAGQVPALLLSLAFLLVAAKLAAALAERVGLPPVLGELLVGILAGNLPGIRDAALAVGGTEGFIVLAELGAILLLFQVGLESTTREMMAVGLPSLVVATTGVVTPMALGYGVGAWMRPGESWMVHAFLGAMLCATSVGITARVLGDLGLTRTREARIILGAAVIDDVMGLAVLAVVSGVITAANAGTPVGLAQIGLILVKAVLFLVGALWIGGMVSPRLFRTAYALRSRGLVQALALGFCFVLSYLALRAGLAPIVGAFAAGLVLEEVHLEEHVRSGDWPLARSLTPLIGLFVPIFFVRMGMLVDLRAFMAWKLIGFAAVLTLAAAVGKLVCAAVVPRGVSRTMVGLGMMPRGEVGLIFAGVGAQLRLAGQPVVDAATYAAAVAMVVATTLATPPLLSWAARRRRAMSPASSIASPRSFDDSVS